MEILSVRDPEFAAYGRILEDLDLSELVEHMLERPCPKDQVIYVPSDPELEQLVVGKEIARVYYGEADIQIGYCNGHNHRMNALEYHRCSELNIACGQDQILILGKQMDLDENFRYDASLAKAFLLPAGMAVEVYATTLHYAPCSVGEGGFRSVVVLTRGTNLPLSSQHIKNPDPMQGPVQEDHLLTAVNKWLLAHPEGGEPEGTFLGIYGENPQV